MSGGIAVQFLLTVGRIYSPGNPARWLLGVADTLGVQFEIKSQALPPSCWTERYRTTLRAWNNVVGFVLVSLWAFRSLSRQGQALRVAFGEPWPLTAPHPAFHQDKPHACSCGWTSPLAPHSEPQLLAPIFCKIVDLLHILQAKYLATLGKPYGVLHSLSSFRLAFGSLAFWTTCRTPICLFKRA